MPNQWQKNTTMMNNYYSIRTFSGRRYILWIFMSMPNAARAATFNYWQFNLKLQEACQMEFLNLQDSENPEVHLN